MCMAFWSWVVALDVRPRLDEQAPDRSAPSLERSNQRLRRGSIPSAARALVGSGSGIISIKSFAVVQISIVCDGISGIIQSGGIANGALGWVETARRLNDVGAQHAAPLPVALCGYSFLNRQSFSVLNRVIP